MIWFGLIYVTNVERKMFHVTVTHKLITSTTVSEDFGLIYREQT